MDAGATLVHSSAVRLIADHCPCHYELCTEDRSSDSGENLFFWSKVKSGDFVKQAGAEDFS